MPHAFSRRGMFQGLGAALAAGRSPSAQNRVVRPYEECAMRMEYRRADPPEKEYVDETLAFIKATGVQAWWFSVVSPSGVPLYPSRAFPKSHPHASREAFRYLIDRAHAAGVNMMSWYALGQSEAIAEVHPEWRMRFLEVPGMQAVPVDHRYICYNSPYRQALYGLCKETVGDLGFDGFWFDGCTFSHHGTRPMFRPACCCEFCRERFRRDTGLEIPTRVDFSSATFRRFLQWRYDILMEVWRGLISAVREANPRATVAFNNYRRRHSELRLSWNTGIPLRRLDLDAVMSCELDGFYSQGDIQMKICRAMGARKGLESWLAVTEYFYWGLDSDPLNHQQAALGLLSAGGVLSAGINFPRDKASYKTQFFRTLHDTIEPRFPYVGGQPILYAANLISQQSMDYSGQNDPTDFWDAAHGVNELLQHTHFLSEVIFDDHVEGGDLTRFPVIIAGNAVCMSARQAAKLREYVDAGGILIATHQAGVMDELGYPHPRPVLDDLLGIRSRAEGPTRGSYEVLDPALKVNEAGFISVFAPRTKAEPAADVQVFFRTHEGGIGVREITNPSPGAWIRTVGKGKAVYFDGDLFPVYLRRPTRSLRDFFARLLPRLAPPPLLLSAPFFVNLNVRRQADEWWVHLHNCPGPGYRYPNPPNSRHLGPPAEPVPVGPLALDFAKPVRSARSGVSGKTFTIKERRHVMVPRLELHDVVVIRFV